ncbi:MAG: hypothetical protein HUJ77_10765 [Clostridium sp.]|uniref:hypothetical protein n=1 Tax=Clostridium sp. TaxID=1506 RepID=UPI0025C022C1|nr:hypothetical protein [Clostridium sp.]MCF0148862.1 hypothetical protein [Clostridium sp.]
MKRLDELILDDNTFLVNGIKGFIKDHERDNENKNIKEIIYTKKVYESKKDTIRFIKAKRKEYKAKILLIENNINVLSNTLKDLEFERNIREDRIKDDKTRTEEFKESLEDIEAAIMETNKIIYSEENKIKKLREYYKNFNDTSLEEEKIVYIFFNYIKREYIRFRRNLVKALNSNTLTGEELILTYEYLLIITKRMICIEEDLLSG